MQTEPDGRVVWNNKSWQLRVEPVTLPDGTVVERAYVDHPGAVVLVPLLGDMVLMLAQYANFLLLHVEPEISGCELRLNRLDN